MFSNVKLQVDDILCFLYGRIKISLQKPLSFLCGDIYIHVVLLLSRI